VIKPHQNVVAAKLQIANVQRDIRIEFIKVQCDYQKFVVFADHSKGKFKDNQKWMKTPLDCKLAPFPCPFAAKTFS